MDYGKLRSLIDKYYMGETSFEEEDVIRKCLEETDIPSEFLAEKLLFDTFADMREQTEPVESLDDDIIRIINSGSPRKIRYMGILKWVSAAAAVVVVLIGVNFYRERDSMKDTFTNEQQAYEVTEKVLTYVSHAMNSGIVKLEDLNQMTAKVSAVNNLQKINMTIDNVKNRKK